MMSATTRKPSAAAGAESKESTLTRSSLASDMAEPHSSDQSSGAYKQAPRVAEAKASTRAQPQPGAKRGGRRHTGEKGLLPWRRWVGKRRNHEVGDLVEAEWAGSGWWYVGYIEGQAIKDGKRKAMCHVVFADGDEADIRGKDLKQLGPPDHTRGSAGTIPRHVPIADLGSGRLHRNLDEESSSSRQGEGSTKGGKQEKKKGSTSHLLRRGSMGSIADRRRQGKKAVWGGHTRSSASSTLSVSGADDHGGVEGDWWDTATQYAFQPWLAANKPTVTWFSHGGAGVSGSTVEGLGRERPGRALGSRRDSSEMLSAMQQRKDGNETATKRTQSMRVVAPARENNDCGQRVFFVA